MTWQLRSNLRNAGFGSETVITLYRWNVPVILALLPTTIASARAKPDSASIKEVDAAVLQQMKDQHIPGLSIAVVRDGAVIKAAGYGYANIEASAPAKPETVFAAGSITKQFVASAIMLLQEQGKVGLDDSIAKYFPEAPFWDATPFGAY